MPTPNNVYSKMGVVYKLLYSHSLFSFCKLIGCRRGQIRTDVPVKGEWWPTWAGFTPAVCSNPLGGSPRTLHLCALLQLVFPSCHPLFVEARLCSGGGNRTLLPEVMSLWGSHDSPHIYVTNVRKRFQTHKTKQLFSFVFFVFVISWFYMPPVVDIIPVINDCLRIGEFWIIYFSITNALQAVTRILIPSKGVPLRPSNTPPVIRRPFPRPRTIPFRYNWFPIAFPHL